MILTGEGWGRVEVRLKEEHCWRVEVMLFRVASGAGGGDTVRSRIGGRVEVILFGVALWEGWR